MLNECFAVTNNNTRTRFQSSSGGIFASLATYIINCGGVVFGAAFDKKWHVEMRYINSLDDLPKLMTSKYVQADTKHTFQEVLSFLNNNKLVLYVGTPCQIVFLKKYLKKDYHNLYTVDLICHGTMPPKIWDDYLKTIKCRFKKIVNINFRDKTKTTNGGGWRNFNFRVDYSNGECLIEHHNFNKYMRLFLGDHYLKESCYCCSFKNEHTLSDITIGDFWTANKNYRYLDDDLGINAVIIRTNKGKEIFNKLNDINATKIDYKEIELMGGGMSSTIAKKHKKYNKNIFKKHKTVGIISVPLDMNPGGVIQSYVLEHLLESFGYCPITISVHRPDFAEHLQFADQNMNIRMLPFSEHLRKTPFHLINQNEFDTILIGSDQIWRRTEIDLKEIFLDFTKGWGINRFVYGASFGSSEWQYSSDDSMYVSKMLSKYFNGVSVREIDGVRNSEKYFNVKTKHVLDPVFLFDKNFYLDICKNVPISLENGVFCHILDASQEKDTFINNLCSKYNLKQMQFNKQSVESWLASIRDCKFVITDSYHGCVFSIIFNKPFLCFYNKERGGSRFDTLDYIFNIKDRFIKDNVSQIDFNLLKQEVVANKKFYKLQNESIKFLKKNLRKKAHFHERSPIIKKNIKNNVKCALKTIFPAKSYRGKLVRFIKHKILRR